MTPAPACPLTFHIRKYGAPTMTNIQIGIIFQQYFFVILHCSSTVFSLSILQALFLNLRDSLLAFL